MRTTGDWMRFCLTAGASALGSKRFLNCVWELTYRCNARCAMCSYWKHPSDPRDELSAAEVKTGLDKVAEYGARLVNFTGGEPTLRRDLEEIVAHASSLGMWTSTVTNGSLLTRERVVALREAGLDSLLVSLDSTDPAVHDAGRGLAGAHEKALRCLEWLADDFLVGHRTGGFMTVISSRNLQTITELVGLADRLGVYILVQPYHGQKTGSAAHFAPVPFALADSLVDLRRTSGGMLNSEGYLRTLPALAAGDAPGACNAGRKYFSVDPFGRLHPCVDTPAVGHVLRDDISVISSEAALAEVRSCPGCWYCFRGEADGTLSAGGCLEKAGLGLRILRRNAERNRETRKTARRGKARPRAEVMGR